MSVAEYTLPVGLLGEFISTALVFSVIQAAMLWISRVKSGFVFSADGYGPHVGAVFFGDLPYKVPFSKVPEEVVYAITKEVFDNFEKFKKLHPAFKNLKESEMIKDGLSAPLHDGAAKYYKEAGLM